MKIADCDSYIVGSGRATIILPMGTTLIINDALLYPESLAPPLSFNGFHANSLQLRPVL